MTTTDPAPTPALDEAAPGRSYIGTVYGVGYRLDEDGA